MNQNFPKSIDDFDAPTGLTIWFLGGPSVAIRTPRTLVYLDLFTGPSPIAELHKATVDILAPQNVRWADAVLCTHHDIDHCHQESLAPIYANTDALFMGPCSCTKLFREWGFQPERMVELAPHQGFQIKDLRIWAMPCNDYFDENGVTYLLQSGGVTAFDGGDTLYYPGFREIGRKYKVDVALLNFARNPPDKIYYMNHDNVARAAEELGVRLLIPKHYDLWEEFLDDPARLIPMLEPKGIEVKLLKQTEFVTITG